MKIKILLYSKKSVQNVIKRTTGKEGNFLAIIRVESLRRGGGLKRSSSENVRAVEPDGI